MSGVEIRVRSNSRQARNDLNQLERSVGNIEKTANSVSKAFRNLAIGVGAAFSGSALTRGINGATDSLVSLENRIALVTGRNKELVTTMDDLFAISKATRQPVDAAAETFNRFGIALKDAGKSSEEILQAIESVGKAAAIGGGSAESTRAALFQLGQGLASGQLRGQELNSVLEQAPRLAQAIADSLGQPMGALRGLAEQGQLTSEVVFNALISQADQLSKEFETIEQTSDQALMVLGDQIKRVVGEISGQLNITGSFIARINQLTNAIEKNRSTIVANVVSFAKGFKDSFEGVIAIGRGVIRIIQSIFNRTIDAIPNITSPFRNFGQILYTEIAGGFLYASAFVKRFGLDLEGIFRRITDTKFSGAIRQVFQSKSLKEFGDALFRIGEVLDRYGKRWYNFGNITEKVLRSTNVFLFETGIALGIVDQQLVRLRYTSFERFGKAASVVADAFKEISKNILASNFIVAVQVGLIKATQILINFGKAIDNLSNNNLSKVLKNTENTFKQVYNFSVKYFKLTKDFIENSLISIERKFFWLYDKVIGNSWWVDTMENVFYSANEWLPKTLSIINTFATKVSNRFKTIRDQVQNSFSSKNKFEITIEKIKFKALSILDSIKDLSTPIANSIANSVREGLKNLRDISPQIAGYISVGLAAALTKAISPSFFGKTFARLGPLAAASIFVGLSTALNGAVLKSGFFESVAQGLGNAIGTGIETIVSNVPQILKAVIRIGVAFGEGLAETIGNSIIGLPAKILSFLPAGGLLTTILYGGLTAAIFFSSVRKQLFGLISSIIASGVSAGTISSSGLLYNLFVGNNPSNLKKQITGVAKDQVDTVAKGLAAQNKRTGLMQLTQLSGFIIGAELLLGDLLGTTGAAIAGIGASLLQTFVIGNPQKAKAIVTQFNSLLSTVISKIDFASAFAKGKDILSGLFTKSSASIIGDLGVVTAANIRTTNLFSSVWQTASAKASAAVNKFSKLGIGRLGKLALITVGVTAAFTGMASAATGDGQSSNMGAVFGTLTTAAILFGDTILSYVIPAIGSLFKSLKVGAAISAFGSAIGSGLTAAGAGIASILAGIPLITGAFIAAAVTITSVGIGGIIYTAFFGEGDNFLERVKNNFEGVLGFFNLLNKDVAKVRSESIKTLKSIEKLSSKEFKINLSAQLANADLGDASDRELLAIERSVKQLDKNRLRADREVARFGQISEETRKAINTSTRAVERAIYSTRGEGTATGNAIESLSPFLDQIVKRNTSFTDKFFPRLKEFFGGQLSEQGKFLKDLRSGAFSAENLEDPEVAKIFGQRITTLFSDTETALPPEILQAFNKLAETGELSFEVVDQLNRFSNRFEGLFGNAVARAFAKGNLTTPQVQLDDLEAATTRQSRQEGAAGFLRRIDTVVNALEKIGVSVSQEDRALFDVKSLNQIQKAINEIAKIEKTFEGLNENLDDPKVVDRILKQSGGDGVNRENLLRLRALRSEVANVFETQIKLQIAPTSVAELNKRLSDIGVSALSDLAGRLTPDFAEDSKQYKDRALNLFTVKSLLDSINRLEAEREQLIDDYGDDEVALTQALNDQDTAIKKANDKLNYRISLINTSLRSEEDFLGLIQQAASSLDNQEVSLNDILKLDNSTLSKIAATQEEILRLKITIEKLGKEPFGLVLDGLDKETARVQLESAEKLLKALFAGIGQTTQETVFEKFVGKFNAAGFNADISQVAALSRKSLTSIISPLNLIEKAQKRIINLGLKDVKGRKAQLDQIKQQREEVFKILSEEGTVSEAKIAFEAIGLDPSIVNESQRAQDISKNILNIQEQLNNTNIRDLGTRKQLTKELEAQERLLEGITTLAEQSSNSLRDALKDGIKGGIQEGLTAGDIWASLKDTFSERVVDTTINSFIDGLYAASGLDDLFEGFFQGLFKSGDSFGKKTGEMIRSAITRDSQGEQGESGLLSGLIGEGGFFSTLIDKAKTGIQSLVQGSGQGGGLSSIIGSISSFFTGIGSSISKGISSLFGGGSAAGTSGGMGMPMMTGNPWLDIGMMALPFLFNDGGIVPTTPYSKAGMDSVPAMLTPGELVVPANKVKSYQDNTNKQQNIVNLSISGDVSRQTRQEIIKMLPTISAGVNATNKENNYKGR